MHALARGDDIDDVTMSESWRAYVRRVTRGLDRKDIARAADINVSGVSRWLTGTSRPSAEKVISFARGLRLDPIQALVAAGYLLQTDVKNTVEIVQSLTALSDDALIEELLRRLRLVDSSKSGLTGLTRLERQVQDVGVEDPHQGHKKRNGPL